MPSPLTIGLWPGSKVTGSFSERDDPPGPSVDVPVVAHRDRREAAHRLVAAGDQLGHLLDVVELVLLLGVRLLAPRRRPSPSRRRRRCDWPTRWPSATASTSDANFSRIALNGPRLAIPPRALQRPREQVRVRPRGRLDVRRSRPRGSRSAAGRRRRAPARSARSAPASSRSPSVPTSSASLSSAGSPSTQRATIALLTPPRMTSARSARSTRSGAARRGSGVASGCGSGWKVRTPFRTERAHLLFPYACFQNV